MKKALEIISNAFTVAMLVLFIIGVCAIDSDSVLPLIWILFSIAYFCVYSMVLNVKRHKIRRKVRNR